MGNLCGRSRRRAQVRGREGQRGEHDREHHFSWWIAPVLGCPRDLERRVALVGVYIHRTISAKFRPPVTNAVPVQASESPLKEDAEIKRDAWTREDPARRLGEWAWPRLGECAREVRAI